MEKLQHFSPGSAAHIDHPSHARIGVQAFPDRLHVLTMLSNPLRWRSRYRHYWRFEAHVVASSAILYTAEVALGGREFEVTEPGNPKHLQLRTHDELWHKENALQLLLGRVPPEARYIAMVDADLIFARSDWAQETLHLLQHYPVLQMFSHLIDLNSDDQPINSSAIGLVYLRHGDSAASMTGARTPASAAFDYGVAAAQGPAREPAAVRRQWGCPGGAWAYRREALDALGGLIDWGIAGNADFHMAKALFGEIEDTLCPGYHPNYKTLCRGWQERAETHIKRNVGYMPGAVLHLWHGPKGSRGYEFRPRLLSESQFDPLVDIKRDWQGLWQLSGDNIALREWLRQCARVRNEDA
jgi:hypothetical protein